MFQPEKQLRFEDVRDDIAAALNLCTAIRHEVVEGHSPCPFHETATKGMHGLTRLLDRFQGGKNELDT